MSLMFKYFLFNFPQNAKINRILDCTLGFALAHGVGIGETVPNIQELKGFLFEYLFAKQAVANGGPFVES